MYCSHCGANASGNFCSRCGTPLDMPLEVELVDSDWTDEVRYDILLQYPEVRDVISRYAAQTRQGMNAEQFLKACDTAFAPIPGVSLAAVANLVVPVYARMGIKTGKKRDGILHRPSGQVLVSALCSLARHGRPLKQVHQGNDGCVLEAVLPSDMWSWEGEVLVSVQRHDSGTRVEAATNIPGQLFDWGKSKRCLNQLFDDLQTLSV